MVDMSAVGLQVPATFDAAKAIAAQHPAADVIPVGCQFVLGRQRNDPLD